MLQRRREKLLARLHVALPRFLEPGERPAAAAQALVPLTARNTFAVVGVLIVGMALAAAALTLDGIVGSAAFGGAIGGTVATMSIMSTRWIVVTDRRLLVLSLRWHDAAPGRLERADPLASVQVRSSTPKWDGVGRATIARGDGSEIGLRSIRMWAADLAVVVSVLQVPAPPGGIPPMPGS